MPPLVETMDSQLHKQKGGDDMFDDILLTPIDDRSVTLHLSDVNLSESLPNRIITLEHPTWSINIGRGSCSDDNIVPEADNAWFTSKVMSRQHATIKACPETMIVTIKDTSSMHGTFLNGKRVTGDAVELLPQDIITFGTDVVRHSESFTPLRTKVVYMWHEKEQHDARKNRDYTNTFTADYSEEDIYSDLDDEVEIVHESIRQPSVEILEHPASSVTTSPSLASDCVRRPSTSLPTSDLNSPIEVTESKAKSDVKVRIIDLFDDLQQEYNSESDNDYPDHQSEEDSICSPSSSDDIPEDSVIDIDDDEDVRTFSELVTKSSIDNQSTVNDAKAARQPSPSDAAMAKPLSISPLDAHLTQTAMSPPHSSSTQFATAPSPQSPVPMALSSPTCSMFGGPQNWNWNGSISSGFPLTASTTAAAAAVGPFGYSVTRSNQFPTPPPPWPAQPSHAPLPRLEQLPSLPLPSFKNTQSGGMYYPGLASQPPLPPTTHGLSRPIKRKAVDISNDQDIERNRTSRSPYTRIDNHEDDAPENDLYCQVGSPPPSSQPNNAEMLEIPSSQTVVQSESITHEGHDIATKMVSESTTNVFTDDNNALELVEEGNQEPQKKKVRTQEPVANARQTGSMMRTAAKYAATALAGASVGAVGVVLGLASLPPNYFA